MLKNRTIRLATEADCAAILDIYAPFIRNTVVTFEYDVPSLTDFRVRLANIIKQYPWLVCEIDGKIVGYAYASRYSERRAYDWSTDASVYVHPDFQRHKIASALYDALFEILKIQGYYNVYAVITAANNTSQLFHEAFGFIPVGIFHHVGFKAGRWLDVKWMELTLNEPSDTPIDPKTVHEIKHYPEFAMVINKAVRMIRE
jgi:phosphinothricin acetyltransferase